MTVSVVCRNFREDRVLPRFAGYLAENLGWPVIAAPVPHKPLYLNGYFEWQRIQRRTAGQRIGGWWTHLEEQPPNNEKARLWWKSAKEADLRIVTAPQYYEMLEPFGPTVLLAPPVDSAMFTLRTDDRSELPLGFSGFIYKNGRKGENLADELVRVFKDQFRFTASGRGWACETRYYSWLEMPAFYDGLRALIITATVEGIPMPPLEALACGLPIIVPRGVGMLDTLPDTPGIVRYDRGDFDSLASAVASLDGMEYDPTALRAIVEPMTIEAWCEGHRKAAEEWLKPAAPKQPVNLRTREAPPRRQRFNHQPREAPPRRRQRIIDGARVVAQPVAEERPPVVDDPRTGERETLNSERLVSSRGIYCVAMGEPARHCAAELLASIREWLPEIPVALCGDRSLGMEDVFIYHPDSDVGGRRAKLRAYDFSPWEVTLYLDVDTIVCGDIRFWFQVIEDGWDMAIAKDPHLMDTMESFQRSNNQQEIAYTRAELGTLKTFQFNGGVWSFARSERMASFFRLWLEEWDRFAQRDQGALIRALWANPLRVFVLGNEWNTFEKYSRGTETAGLMHYPGKARRWRGQIPGRMDSDAAWNMVARGR